MNNTINKFALIYKYIHEDLESRKDRSEFGFQFLLHAIFLPFLEFLLIHNLNIHKDTQIYFGDHKTRRSKNHTA